MFIHPRRSSFDERAICWREIPDAEITVIVLLRHAMVGTKFPFQRRRRGLPEITPFGDGSVQPR